MFPPARFVPGQMEELFDWMNKARTSVHFIKTDFGKWRTNDRVFKEDA